MAIPRSTSKMSPKWVRQTRQYFLTFLCATPFPPVKRHGRRGKTFEYPEWLVMLIGVLAVTCQAPTYLGIQRLTCRFWGELGGRQVRLPPISESQWRARLKKIGSQLGTTPGYVVHIFSPAYLMSGGQWRYDDAQGMGPCLAHEAKSATDPPSAPAGSGPGSDWG